MRFPNLSQLDKDQAAIYRGAPLEGTVLVTGPPGTGKTVIAFYRAHVLSKKGRKPRVMMYNKVLAQYTTERSGVAPDVSVSTLHSWVASWWGRIHGRDAGWPPTVNGSPYEHDWDAIRDRILPLISSGDRISQANWDHLVVDEGQDFPPLMYRALNFLMAVANAKGASPQMAITVMADENQRLKAFQNSTIADIRTSLGLHAEEKTVFNLRKNYRNTREIAAFASRFYVGLPTGIPEPPTDTGPKPVLSVCAKESHGGALNEFVVKIARYMTAHPTEEIGVICMSDADRKSMFNRLKARLANDEIEVQTYASKDHDHPADALEFDVPGRLTVLNYHSAKGLEFDAAFIVDPGKLSSGGSSDLNVKMTLYVMCSRARQFLNLLIIRDQGCKRILDWLGNSSLYKQEEL